MSPDPRGDWLVGVAGWGRQSVHDAPDGRGAELIYELDVGPGGDVDAVLDVATRWQRARHHGLLALRHASASSDRRGVRICWLAPSGSTLEEVAGRAGPMDERMVAALGVDLAASVAHAHARELIVGRISPLDLFVAPPGSEGLAALRILAAGLPGLVAAAGHDVGMIGERGFAMLYDAPRYVAPEVAAGRAPTAASDDFALAATLARLLLGRPPFPSHDERLLLHAMQQGPSPDTTAALRRAAPTLAGPLLAALSPSPLQRAGSLADLRAAIAEVLGEAALGRVSIVRGGGPWEMGSPIVPLAAWAGAGAFADRFSSVAEQRERQRRSTRSQPAASGDEAAADPTPLAPPVRDAVAQAKLESALRDLDVQRAVARQGRQRSRVVDVVVIVATAIIAAVVVWLGAQRRDAERSKLPARATAPWNQPRAKVPGPRRLMRWPKPEDRAR